MKIKKLLPLGILKGKTPYVLNFFFVISAAGLH